MITGAVTLNFETGGGGNWGYARYKKIDKFPADLSIWGRKTKKPFKVWASKGFFDYYKLLIRQHEVAAK